MYLSISRDCEENAISFSAFTKLMGLLFYLFAAKGFEMDTQPKLKWRIARLRINGECGRHKERHALSSREQGLCCFTLNRGKLKNRFCKKCYVRDCKLKCIKDIIYLIYVTHLWFSCFYLSSCRKACQLVSVNNFNKFAIVWAQKHRCNNKRRRRTWPRTVRIHNRQAVCGLFTID